MKYLALTIILIAIIFSFFMRKEEAMVPYPNYKSVVINDGRNYCEKASEMYAVWSWEGKCQKAGLDKHCSLKESVAKQVFVGKDFTYSSCMKK